MSTGEVTISAVMPVHGGADPADLAAAVASLLGQSRLPDEVVIVEDGPLMDAHLVTLSDLEQRHPRVVRIRLEVNAGAGEANQAGLMAAAGEWIAKFDADDICLPHRIERQMAALEASGADVCGGAMLEFVQDPERPVAIRRCPLEHDLIARRMRFNNPINHPTSMYRRDVALSAGGYADLRFMQDYDMFARMLVSGARMINLSEPLVLFRADDRMRRRRSARELTVLEWQLQRRLRAYGLIGRFGMGVNLVLRLAFRRLPAPLLTFGLRHVLSRPTRGSDAGMERPGRARRVSGMLRHQLRLMGRSVRLVVRTPRLARELPRLLATRGRGTMTLRLPWLPFRLIDELEEVVGAGYRVFEYGGGGSTLWFLDRGATVVTVEHHERWAQHLRTEVRSDHWTLLERSGTDGYAAYIAAIEDYEDEWFDLVVVDGRERARCVAAALPKVRRGGLLIVDDADRERYTAALQATGWPRRDVVGFAPAKPTLAHSAVLRRPAADV